MMKIDPDVCQDRFRRATTRARAMRIAFDRRWSGRGEEKKF